MSENIIPCLYIMDKITVKLLKIDYNAIQKAMEDVARNALDYFMDLETGRVLTISIGALEDAKSEFYRDEELLDEVLLEGYEMPEQVEKELELAVKIFSDKTQRYMRIPERQSEEAYSLMKEFTEKIDELHPYEELSSAINSNNPFSRFKKALADYPAYREKWFAFNAGAMKKTIIEWFESIGIKPEQEHYQL